MYHIRVPRRRVRKRGKERDPINKGHLQDLYVEFLTSFFFSVGIQMTARACYGQEKKKIWAEGGVDFTI